jgi:thiosulfate/3-mercaptopyruvate sulfurtransferase
MQSPLITAAELAARLGDPQLLLVDCRFDLADRQWAARSHAASHLPGAVFADMDRDLAGPVTADSGRHPLPAPTVLAAALSRWGYHPGCALVAYDQGHGAGAARLWWLMRAAGWPAPQVLDGGLAAWTKAGLPLTDTVTERVPTQVEPRPFGGWLTSEAVQEGLAGNRLVLVDARSADRFAGRNESIDPVAGHVPGSINSPFLENLGADGCFLPVNALRERWLARLAGRDAGDVVALCGSGITACHNLLALEHAGLGGGKLYAGSWSEWIRDPARPVATSLPDDAR